MMLTVTVSTRKYLSLKDGSLLIQDKVSGSGSLRVVDKIPLSDIWVIIIDNPQVVMTAALISHINDAGIGVMFTGQNHMPNGLCLPLGAHSRHAEIVEHQLSISKPLRNQLWKKIVMKKIENQAKVLEILGNDPGAKTIRNYARNVQSNDKTQQEGPAASEYFKQLLPHGTRREGPYAAPLDFGYAVMRSGIAQCAVSHGWLVSRGIHHHSAENAFNLVDDLIEPFRPVVDLLVIEENILDPLSSQNKALLIESTLVYVTIAGKRCPVQGAIDTCVESLRRAVELRDADQLFLPDVIGSDRLTVGDLRAKGWI